MSPLTATRVSPSSLKDSCEDGFNEDGFNKTAYFCVAEYVHNTRRLSRWPICNENKIK